MFVFVDKLAQVTHLLGSPEAVCSCGGFTFEASTHLLHQPGQHGINQFGGIQTDIDDEAPDAQLEENALFLQFQVPIFVLHSKTYSKILRRQYAVSQERRSWRRLRFEERAEVGGESVPPGKGIGGG